MAMNTTDYLLAAAGLTGGGGGAAAVRGVLDGTFAGQNGVYHDDLLTTLKQSVLSPCHLTAVVLPGVREIGGSAFRSSELLASADLGAACASIGMYAFQSTALTVLVLRYDGVVAINSATVFSGTPVMQGTGTLDIYVPAARIADYEAHAKWSAALSQAGFHIHAIEGSPYERCYVDGVPVPEGGDGR